MTERNFQELSQWQVDNQRQVCVGLDTNIQILKKLHDDYPGLKDELRPFARSLRTDAEYVLAYNHLIIAATQGVAGAYKPNKAYYEELGANGFRVLKDTVSTVQAWVPEAMTILDAKIQDIGPTNDGYGRAYFDKLGFDAVTVHNYLGKEALSTLASRTDKGFLVMGRTSNPGGGEFQDLKQALTPAELDGLLIGLAGSTAREDLFDQDQEAYNVELYKYVALRVANHWNTEGNFGLVAGATYPTESGHIRRLVGRNLFLLIPGVGKQGGKADQIVPEALRKGQKGGLNSSRELIFPKRLEGETQFQAIQRATQALHNEIVTAQNG